MRLGLLFAAAAALLYAAASPASASEADLYCYDSVAKVFHACSTTLPVPVTGTLVPGGALANNADAVAAVTTGLSPVQSYPFLWNGGTFDRWYGDKTNGAFVNVKTSVLPTGAALDATVGTTNTDVGPPGATACATDTGSCSLNALLQRIAQRLTSAIGGTAVTLATAPSLVTGSALIGSTSTFGRIEATPTIQNASYVSGNSLGTLNTFTLPRTASGLLQSVGVQFKGGATTQVNAFCFDSNPTGSTFTDKSTFTIAAEDEAKLINKTGFALTPAAVVGNTVSGAAIDNYAKPFNSTGAIYCAVVSTGTFTPASTTDMVVVITYEQGAL